MAKKEQSPAQRRVQAAMRKASKQASKEGKKGNAYKTRVKTLFKQNYNPPKGTKKKSSPKKKSGGRSKGSTKSSNPAGGARMKLGATFRKLKAAFNFTAGIQGAATLPGADSERKMRDALSRHTGVMTHADGTMEFNIDAAVPTWQALITEAGFQYFDGKTRHYGNITRHKLLDIAEELLPIWMAHTDGSASPDYMTGAMRSYHKQTQGYDMHGTNAATGMGGGNWDLSRVNTYAAVKAVRALGNASGFTKWINRRLPKGLNL